MANAKEGFLLLQRRAVEWFSDLKGVVFIPLDEYAGWLEELDRELRAIGILSESA